MSRTETFTAIAMALSCLIVIVGLVLFRRSIDRHQSIPNDIDNSIHQVTYSSCSFDPEDDFYDALRDYDF